MNRVDCTTAGCGNSEPFNDDHPEGWMYVKATHPPRSYKGDAKFFVGTCSACVRKSREQPVKCPGGPRFRPETWEGDSTDEKPRQKSLFGDE